MASYAIIGATGNCGNSLVQVLLQTPNVKVHAFCRSKAKLTRLLPETAENKRVQVFEGNLDNTELLARCIAGCRAVFLTVATNDNVPGCSIALDTAKGVIDALKLIKVDSPDAKMPKIVPLSSATIDPWLGRHMPWWFRPVMLTAASHVYADLRVAETFLRSQQEWVQTIFIKPGGLSIDTQKGHKLSLDHEESFISYLDLAAAMVEAADATDGIYDMKNVSVINAGGKARFPPGTPKCIMVGLLRHFFPWLHQYLPSSGPA